MSGSSGRFNGLEREKGIRMTDVAPSGPLDGDRRPGVITFVAVLLYIQAAMAIFAGVFGYLNRDNADTQAALGLESDTQFLWFLIIELAIALVVLIVAGGIMNGARWARILVTIGMGFRLVQATLFATLGGTGGAGLLAAVLYAIIPLIVLWALWGHDRGEAYFHRLRA